MFFNRKSDSSARISPAPHLARNTIAEIISTDTKSAVCAKRHNVLEVSIRINVKCARLYEHRIFGCVTLWIKSGRSGSQHERNMAIFICIAAPIYSGSVDQPVLDVRRVLSGYASET